MEDGSPEFGDNRLALPICESIEEGGGVGLLQFCSLNGHLAQLQSSTQGLSSIFLI
jgi:hypothetical protein